MLIVLNENTSAYFNLAAEEYMLKHFKEDVFMLWRGKDSVLIGKNQNALKEIHYPFVKANGIDVVRRISGGGTVFCDLGNTNFSFITTQASTKTVSFKQFVLPILEVLKNLGANAAFSGRNDLTIEGKKISGNAQYRDKGRVLHHGTLLFSSNMGKLIGAINPSKVKYKGSGVDSVKSRVTNIQAHISDSNMDILTFREAINQHILSTVEGATYYTFTDEDLCAIKAIEAEKYRTHQWNYGASPQFTGYAEEKFAGGVLEAAFTIQKGVVEDVLFTGDFFSNLEVEQLCIALRGTAHDYDALKAKLVALNYQEYLLGIEIDEVLSLLF